MNHKLNLQTVLRYLDDVFTSVAMMGATEPIYVGIDHNGEVDRDLTKSMLHRLKARAKTEGWYDTSIWVTGYDTLNLIADLYGIKSIVEPGAIRTNRPLILLDRPVLGLKVASDTISRVYLINYGDSNHIGLVLGDLQ